MSREPIVFISYSAKDESLAGAIHAFLNSAGIKALKAPNDIAPGTDWAAAITAMIERCTHMVLVWTSNSMASQEVSKELTLAMQCGAAIIPFRSENLAPEGAWRYHLSHVQWLEAHGMPEGKALEALALQVGGAPSASPPLPANPSQQPQPADSAASPRPSAEPVGASVAPPSALPPYTPRHDLKVVRSRRLAAGLLALFLGGLGAHKFYLGLVIPGCIYLATWVVMIIAAAQGTGSDPTAEANTADLIAGLLLITLGVVPFAEAITYFTRSAADFERINLVGKRPWF